MGAVARTASPVPERQRQRRCSIQGHLDPGGADTVRICLGQGDLPVREGEIGAARPSPREEAGRGWRASQPEIKLPDQLVVVELVGGTALEGDLAVDDDVAAVRD